MRIGKGSFLWYTRNDIMKIPLSVKESGISRAGVFWFSDGSGASGGGKRRSFLIARPGMRQLRKAEKDREDYEFQL